LGRLHEGQEKGRERGEKNSGAWFERVLKTDLFSTIREMFFESALGFFACVYQ